MVYNVFNHVMQRLKACCLFSLVQILSLKLFGTKLNIVRFFSPSSHMFPTLLIQMPGVWRFFHDDIVYQRRLSGQLGLYLDWDSKGPMGTAWIPVIGDASWCGTSFNEHLHFQLDGYKLLVVFEPEKIMGEDLSDVDDVDLGVAVLKDHCFDFDHVRSRHQDKLKW